MYCSKINPPVRIKLKDGLELTMEYGDFARLLEASAAASGATQTPGPDMLIQIQPQPNNQPPVPLPEDVYRIQTSRLAGFHHHGQDAWLHQMKPGDGLELVAEPANPHDKYAVRVHWQGNMVGYLPRSSNHVVSRLLRQGAPLRAVVAWINANEAHGVPMTLHVLAPKF